MAYQGQLDLGADVAGITVPSFLHVRMEECPSCHLDPERWIPLLIAGSDSGKPPRLHPQRLVIRRKYVITQYRQEKGNQ